MRNARCKRHCWTKERVYKTGDVEGWRFGVDEKRVAKAVEPTEKASREHDLAKQP